MENLLLNEELLRQLSLMNYDRSKTLIEQSENKKDDITVKTLVQDDSTKHAIEWVKTNGFTPFNLGQGSTDFYSDCKSANQVYAKAALYGMKKITDMQIGRTAIGNYDCMTVKISDIDGSAPAPFTMKNFSTDTNFKNKLNGLLVGLLVGGVSESGDISVGSVFFLKSFYFEFPKLVDDYKKAFNSNKDAYNSDLFPDGWLNFFNYWYSSSSFTDVLNKVNSSEKFRCSGNEIKNITHGDDWQLENAAGTMAVLHVLLPVGSIILSFMSGGLALPLLFGSALELADSAIYEYYDKDEYCAGLTAIFAFIGPFDIFLKPFIAKGGRALLRKIFLKEVEYTDEELEVLQYISRNGAKFTKLTKMGIARQLVKQFFAKIKITSKLIRFIISLVRRLGLTFINLAAIMGIPFFTWDFIAAKLGICNNMELKGLQQSDWKILKIIGYAGPYIQPFTEGCNSILANEALTKLEKKYLTMNGRIKTSCQNSAESGFVYDTKLSKIYMHEVLYIQFLLKYLGYTKYKEEYIEYIDKWVKVEKPKKPALYIPPQREIPGITSYDTEGGIGAARRSSQLPTTGNLKTDSEKLGELIKTSVPTKKTRTVTVSFKYGYYDDATKKLVESYQKDRNLLSDGVCGKSTLKRMVKSIDNLQNEIPNYNNTDLSPKEISRVRNEVMEAFKQLKINYDSMTSEDAETKFEEKKDKIEKKVQDEIENIEFTEDEISFFNEAAGEYGVT